MAWDSASFESILAMIVALLFAIAGVVNLAGIGAVKLGLSGMVSFALRRA